MKACGQGVSAAFLYVPIQGDLGLAAAYLRDAGVQRATVLSSIDAANDSVAAAFNRERHCEAEDAVAASGLACTCLRPGAFASNALRFFVPQLAGGDVVRLPFPESQQSPIDARDIARVAARAVTTSELDGRKPVLTGPRSMSQYEQVEVLGRVLGRSLVVEKVTPEASRTWMRARIPERYVEMLLGQWEEETHKESVVTSEVERITGTRATDYEVALGRLMRERED